MRTLGEIIESAKSGKKPTHDECYWSMLALESLGTLDSLDIRKLLEPSKIFTPEHVHEKNWDRWKKALGIDPKVWIGPHNDPSSAEYQKQREISKKIYLSLINKNKT